MEKTLYGDEYSAEDLREMENREVEELGYCPRCAREDGIKAELIQGGGCATCVRCAWSPCKVS